MTLRDPYSVLAVPRNASAEDIKTAFRRMAKESHPDRNPGDKKSEQRFKDINAAYDLLSNPAKRARFDRGEIDAQGNERAGGGFGGGFGSGFGSGFSSGGRRTGGGGAGNGDFAKDFGGFAGGGSFTDDIFAELFGTARGGQAGARAGKGGDTGQRIRGSDVTYDLTISFIDAAKGSKQRLALQNGKTIDVGIKPATADGTVLRLKGQGLTGLGAGMAGDALVTVHVAPHAYFTLKGLDLHLDLPVTLAEAVLGTKIKTPTLEGAVTLTIPPHSNSGTVLRLKGKGLSRDGQEGDQYVTLKVVLPEKMDDELIKNIEKHEAKSPYHPRRKAGLE